MTWISTVLGLLALTNLVYTANILAVYPTPSISHQVVFRPLTEELARKGHNIVVITTDPIFKNTVPNITEIDVHDVSYEIWKEFYEITSSGEKQSLLTQLKVGIELMRKIVLKQVQSKEIQKIIKKDKFDLLLIEAWVRQALIYSHFFKAPVIQISSFTGFYGNYEAVGAPTHPLLYPLTVQQKINNLTFWEKVTELYNFYTRYYGYLKTEAIDNSEFRKNFGDVPDLSDLRKNVEMLFLNVNPIWDSNRPVPPNVVYMGGIHQKPKKELPKDLKAYLDRSKNGVIYISFGTNVNPSNLPPEKIQIMIKVFSEMPYDVLWKWDKDILPGKTKNIRIEKWLPQSDLLQHPKIKLFITQGGLQSTDEAITAGVPLVGIPMLGDQWFNVERYVQLNIGVRLDLDSMSEESFQDAVGNVLGNPSYRESILKLRNLMQDQPETPLNRTIWWIEHVIRHGGAKHLRGPAANIPWEKYFEIEIMLFLIAIFLLVLLISAIYLVYIFFNVKVHKMKQS